VLGPAVEAALCGVLLAHRLTDLGFLDGGVDRLIVGTTTLREEACLLGTTGESSLATSRLKTGLLEDALEGLDRGTMTTTTGERGRAARKRITGHLFFHR
jgi:hypothetical protein